MQNNNAIQSVDLGGEDFKGFYFGCNGNQNSSCNTII